MTELMGSAAALAILSAVALGIWLRVERKGRRAAEAEVVQLVADRGRLEDELNGLRDSYANERRRYDAALRGFKLVGGQCSKDLEEVAKALDAAGLPSGPALSRLRERFTRVSSLPSSSDGDR